MKRFMVLALVVCSIGLIVAQAPSDHELPQSRSTPQFELLKQLEGDWLELDNNHQPTGQTAHYRLTSGGSTLVETTFVGTPMETITIFFVDGQQLKLTHYGLLQNQPTMQAKAAKQFNVVEFEFTEGTNITSSASPHMHRAKFTFLNQDHYQAEWTHFAGGEPAKTMLLNMTREGQPEEKHPSK